MATLSHVVMLSYTSYFVSCVSCGLPQCCVEFYSPHSVPCSCSKPVKLYSVQLSQMCVWRMGLVHTDGISTYGWD